MLQGIAFKMTKIASYVPEYYFYVAHTVLEGE